MFYVFIWCTYCWLLLTEVCLKIIWIYRKVLSSTKFIFRDQDNLIAANNSCPCSKKIAHMYLCYHVLLINQCNCKPLGLIFNKNKHESRANCMMGFYFLIWHSFVSFLKTTGEIKYLQQWKWRNIWKAKFCSS